MFVAYPAGIWGEQKSLRHECCSGLVPKCLGSEVLWNPWYKLIREPIRCTAGGFKKCFWLLVIAGMTAALMYNIVELTKKYLSHPISVKLSVDHQQQLTFPSITVCNMSPIKMSAWRDAHNAQMKRRRKRSIGICYWNRIIIYAFLLTYFLLNRYINELIYNLNNIP